MKDYQGTTGPHATWEETYRNIPAQELPWNAGMADGDLQDLLAVSGITPGKAYDLGCGPGNDAAFLAKAGWNVTAVDISPSAVELAKGTAAREGVGGKVQFLVSDVLALPLKADGALVHDRGCFHTLPSALWSDYLKVVTGLLRQDGLLALKVFSFKVPEGLGPCRFTPEEMERAFDGTFQLVSVKEGVFHGPRKPFSLFCAFKKKVHS